MGSCKDAAASSPTLITVSVSQVNPATSPLLGLFIATKRSSVSVQLVLSKAQPSSTGLVDSTLQAYPTS